VSVKAGAAAAGLGHGAARPGSPPAPDGVPPAPDAPDAPDGGEYLSARMAEARSRASERGDRQRQALRPLGVVFLAVVLTTAAQTHPAPALHGAGLSVALLLVVYAAAVLTGISVKWARRGPAAQAATIALIGGCGVALAVLQPHGPVEIAASLGVWIAAVRLPAVPAAVAAGAITTALAVAVGLTEQPAVPSAVTAVLLGLLLAVTGQFIRRGRESQDRTELLLAQLQDAREAEAAAAALAERSRIAGELHDVLAHSLSGLAIQLQGARKLAGREAVSDGLRAAIERSAELTKAGLADARQAVSALRGEQLPTLDQLGALVEGFRRDTGADVTLRIDGTSRPLPAEASLALFRGAQEALTNITRYAPGATTAVTVSYQADRTVVTIEDHLCSAGADPGPAPPVTGPAPPARSGLLADAGGGHGLTAMRERAQRAGGTARSGPTADGWLVELEVPG
jgi:signal transduction histidine kinase